MKFLPLSAFYRQDGSRMAVANCRCGQPLEMPPPGVEHVTCPRCSAKVRLIRKRRELDLGPADDGYIRFPCPCGRRLKVSSIDRPTHGKCPDCDRIVPVPTGAGSASTAESPTEEIGSADAAMLESWVQGHLGRGKSTDNGTGKSNGRNPTSTAEMSAGSTPGRAEAGFRVCPKCSKPIHLNAEVCRGCGTTVPKR